MSRLIVGGGGHAVTGPLEVAAPGLPWGSYMKSVAASKWGTPADFGAGQIIGLDLGPFLGAALPVG